MTAKDLSEREKQAAALLGFKLQSIGKTQARQNFLPLVDALGRSGSAIEITEHDKPVAMLLSYNHWLGVISKLAMLSDKDLSARPPNLIGSIQVVNDLEVASKRAGDQLTKSISETTKNL